MGFIVHSLGSGSSGNSMLVRTGGTQILLDAGLSLLQLQKRLARFQVAIGDLNAILLTHEHGDHAKSAFTLSRRYDIPIVGNPATLAEVAWGEELRNPQPMDTGTTCTIGDLLAESFPISHDAVDPVGYNLYFKNWKVSYLTDTGIVTDGMRERIEGANLAVVEANHDVDRLVAGPYPWYLKNRVLGNQGHLSNESAADLILQNASHGRPATYWLAHLSATNNSPRMARRCVQSRLSEAKCRNVVLDVALRDNASLTWRAGTRGMQIDLFQG